MRNWARTQLNSIKSWKDKLIKFYGIMLHDTSPIPLFVAQISLKYICLLKLPGGKCRSRGSLPPSNSPTRPLNWYAGKKIKELTSWMSWPPPSQLKPWKIKNGIRNPTHIASDVVDPTPSMIPITIFIFVEDRLRWLLPWALVHAFSVCSLLFGFYCCMTTQNDPEKKWKSWINVFLFIVYTSF